MKIQMTCWCGGTFLIEDDLQSVLSKSLFDEAERWRMFHQMCVSAVLIKGERDMKAVQLSVKLPEEDVRKLAEFIKEQCRLDRNVALEEAALIAEHWFAASIAKEIRSLKEKP